MRDDGSAKPSSIHGIRNSTFPPAPAASRRTSVPPQRSVPEIQELGRERLPVVGIVSGRLRMSRGETHGSVRCPTPNTLGIGSAALGCSNRARLPGPTITRRSGPGVGRTSISIVDGLRALRYR